MYLSLSSAKKTFSPFFMRQQKYFDFVYRKKNNTTKPQHLVSTRQRIYLIPRLFVFSFLSTTCAHLIYSRIQIIGMAPPYVAAYRDLIHIMYTLNSSYIWNLFVSVYRLSFNNGNKLDSHTICITTSARAPNKFWTIEKNMFIHFLSYIKQK